MKNLENFGVVELKKEQMMEVDGGRWELFGRNDLGGDPNSGFYTINLFGVPVAIGYRFR